MPDFPAIVAAIDRDLPEIARSVIRRHLDLDQPANRRFLERPDARDQHQTHWHQWGIITHTRVFLKDYETDVPRYLEEWGHREQVESALGDTIDGVSKKDLLRITILLHDIGKFGARSEGRHSFHFANHETLSGQIILCELDLAEYGLTDSQIRYIARTASDHFVLGLVRKRARERGHYDEDFVESEEFVEIARSIRREHPDDSIEVGVLFLGDSLAKARPQDGPERAVSQYDINIVVARRYLDVVLAKPRATDKDENAQ